MAAHTALMLMMTSDYALLHKTCVVRRLSLSITSDRCNTFYLKFHSLSLSLNLLPLCTLSLFKLSIFPSAHLLSRSNHVNCIFAGEINCSWSENALYTLLCSTFSSQHAQRNEQSERVSENKSKSSLETISVTQQGAYIASLPTARDNFCGQ